MDRLQPSTRTRQTATELRRATSLLQRRMRRESVAGGLSAGRAAILAQLGRSDGPQTPSELAAAEGLQPQSVTRILAELVEAGQVSRHRDPRDRRQARLGLTDAGKDALAREARDRDRWLGEAMTNELSPAERALLRSAADLVTRLCETPPPLTEAELPPSAVPILPTHDAALTRECLGPLGFEVRRGSDDGYLMVGWHGLELHYQHTPDVDPFRTASSAFVSVPDVDAFHREVLASRAVTSGTLVVLDAGDGAGDPIALRTRWARERSVARIGPPEDKPWRVRELALFDPTGNLLRVGHPIGLNRRLVTRRSATT